MKKELITKQEALTYLDQGKKETSEFLYRVLNSIDWEGGGGGDDSELTKYYSDRGYGYLVPEGLKAAADESYIYTKDWTVYNLEWYSKIDSNVMYNIKIMPSLPVEWEEDFSLEYILGGKQRLMYAPELDLSACTSMDYAFSGSSSVVYVPLYNTSNVTSMIGTFSNTAILTVPLYDTSNVINMEGMFGYCMSLFSVPLLNTSKVTQMAGMLQGCSNLKTIPSFDFSVVQNLNSFCSSCEKLEEVPDINSPLCTSMSEMFIYSFKLKKVGAIDCTSLTTDFVLEGPWGSNINPFIVGSNNTLYEDFTDFGGFQNIAVSFYLNACPALTTESLVNVLNGLRDLTGQTPKSCNLGAVNSGKLTPTQEAIATNKNWSISY